MSCIVLIGGIVGCGKTTLIRFIQENESDLFGCNFPDCDKNLNSACIVTDRQTKTKCKKTNTIIFDDLCSINEQAHLMKTLKGWRNFRCDLLMAAEFFICTASDSECRMFGPLSERSHRLLEKLKSSNVSCSNNLNTIFFVEDNFYYRSMRYEWFQIARRANIGFCQVFLQCPVSLALYRNSTRGYSIPEERIKNMFKSMEYPDPDKYRWEKYSIVFDSSPPLECSLLSGMTDVIERAINNPAELIMTKEKTEAQQICSKNIVHQADKILRKLISRTVAYCKGNAVDEEQLKHIVTAVICIRQDLLNNIRQGVINIPSDILDKIQNLGIGNAENDFQDYLNELFQNSWKEKVMDLNLKLVNLEIS